MSRPSLPLIAREEAGGEVALCAPKIGIFLDPPAPGSPLGPGSAAGSLRQLARRYALLVPDGVFGVVAGAPSADRARPVGYGDELFRVAAGGVASRAANAPGAAAVVGARPISAPTDGVFYARAAPGSPPFAPKGARVTAGQTVGLIEVMKTFHPIVYDGGAPLESAEVVEVLAGDGEEVRVGQPLLLVR